MSVIVKGIKMPARCELCPFSGISGISCERISCTFTGRHRLFNDGQYLDGCPLVEMPTLHGDLIDRRELIKQIDKIECYSYDPFVAHMSKCINEAPTIIEEER